MTLLRKLISRARERGRQRERGRERESGRKRVKAVERNLI